MNGTRKDRRARQLSQPYKFEELERDLFNTYNNLPHGFFIGLCELCDV
jgi:hypothetical protein